MLVGHTKFAPDWCFGLFKQRYRRTFVSSLDDVVEVVNTSADANVAQLVGTQRGEQIVPVYDWSAFLGEHFRSLPNLKRYHHFSFSSQHPGMVALKEFSDSVATLFPLLHDTKWSPAPDRLPSVINPTGLSPARQWYLFREIREFCRPGTEDLVCPKPSHFLCREDTPVTTEGTEDTTAMAPQAKRGRRHGRY